MYLSGFKKWGKRGDKGQLKRPGLETYVGRAEPLPWPHRVWRGGS